MFEIKNLVSPVLARNSGTIITPRVGSRQVPENDDGRRGRPGESSGPR